MKLSSHVRIDPSGGSRISPIFGPVFEQKVLKTPVNERFCPKILKKSAIFVHFCQPTFGSICGPTDGSIYVPFFEVIF